MAVIGTISALMGVGVALILNYVTIYKKSKLIGDMIFLIIGLIMLIPFNNTDYVGISFGVILIAFADAILNTFRIKNGKVTPR